jgi:hypothetical protein
VDDKKVSCETLLEIFRNCSSKKPVKIFSNTINKEHDKKEGEPLWSSSFKNGSVDWGVIIEWESELDFKPTGATGSIGPTTQDSSQNIRTPRRL